MAKSTKKQHGGKIQISSASMAELIGNNNPQEHGSELISALDFAGGELVTLGFDPNTKLWTLLVNHADLPLVVNGAYEQVIPVYTYHDMGVPAKRVFERIEPKKGNN